MKQKHASGWKILVGLWLVAGLYFSREDIRLLSEIARFQTFSNEDQEKYLFGSDYLAYQEIARETQLKDRIAALVPDPYYFYKMTYFLYPREITVVSDIEKLQALKATGNYDWVYIYRPPSDKYWGLFRLASWWPIGDVHTDPLGNWFSKLENVWLD